MSERAEGPASAASRLLYSVEEAADLLGIGRTYMFHLLRTGEIDSLKIGKRWMVPGDALDNYIEHLRSANAAIARKPGSLRQLPGQRNGRRD